MSDRQWWLSVEYEDGSRELFDREASLDEVAALSAHLKALSECAGATCRDADIWPDPT
ncbi:MAG: hypothetical protein F2793_00075 [Actinobacteria bacterium]|nr:hypothetical protein [Actinomycetota bacterium]